jgi:hypothetical protein
MNAQNLLGQLQSKGVRFEPDGEDFRILAPRGLLTPALLDEIKERKPEILALLSQAKTQPEISHLAGLCPHCRQKLTVYTHALDEEVWIVCPTRPDLFKGLRHQSNRWCRDCGERLPVVAGRCKDCIRRLLLAPDYHCDKCGGSRFWRHLANRYRPAGFAWYCTNCIAPAGKVAVYQLTNELKGGVESLCQQQGM